MKISTFIAAVLLFMALRPAQAMQHDFSNTWCAKHIPESAMKDRTTYYSWIDKCHRRRGTKPVWKLPCLPEQENNLEIDCGRLTKGPAHVTDCDEHDQNPTCDNPTGWNAQCNNGNQAACRALDDLCREAGK